MNLVGWLIVGSLAGWVASMLMHTQPRRGLATSIVVGVAGALLGGFFINPLVAGANANQTDFSVVGLLVSIGGAVSLLALMELVRRRTAD